MFSGGSRNFKTGGRGPGMVDFFRSGVCFDAPSHILSVFEARVLNKIHNVHIVYLLKSNYMRVIQSKFTKQTRNFVQNGGGGRTAPLVFIMGRHEPAHYMK